jgi:1-acyl-sn-glycerol-3-phosphate acyltransferase
VNPLQRVRRAFQASRRAPGRPAHNMFLWWNAVRGMLWVLFKTFYRLQAEGAQHVPDHGPVIYVANHQSHLDPCVIGVLVGDRPFAGMARSTLFDNPVLGMIMRSIGVISLNQSRGDTAAFRAALGELQAGRCVLIFPEGTRTRDGAIHTFKAGASLLIRRSGAPVVPVAVEGAFDIWPIGTSRPRLTGRLAVRAAAPISADEVLANGADAGLARLQVQIDNMRLELRDRMRRQSGGRYPAKGPADGPTLPPQ